MEAARSHISVYQEQWFDIMLRSRLITERSGTLGCPQNREQQLELKRDMELLATDSSQPASVKPYTHHKPTWLELGVYLNLLSCSCCHQVTGV